MLQWVILCSAVLSVSHASLNVAHWPDCVEKDGMLLCVALRCIHFHLIAPGSVVLHCVDFHCVAQVFLFVPYFSLPFLSPILPRCWVAVVRYEVLGEFFGASLKMELAMNTMWGHWVSVLSSSRLCRLESLLRVWKLPVAFKKIQWNLLMFSSPRPRVVRDLLVLL